MASTVLPYGLLKNGFIKEGLPVVDWDHNRSGQPWCKPLTMECEGDQDMMMMKLQTLFDALPSESNGVNKASVARVQISGNISGPGTRTLSVFVSYDEKKFPVAGDIAFDPVALAQMRSRLRGQPAVGLGLTHRTWDIMPNTRMMLEVCQKDRIPVVLIRTTNTDMKSPLLTNLLVVGVIEVDPNGAAGSGDAQKKMMQLLALHSTYNAQPWPWNAPQL